MDTKGLQNEFIAWCKKNNHSPKSEDETKQLFVAFMKEKHPEEYKQAMLNQQKQATKALHGAKLNYFKNLKNQCAEDEEVVYYKKGGSVTCGCKKKEQGGEVPTAKTGSAIEKFKNRQINPNDTIHVNGQIKSLTNEPIKDKSNTYKSLTIEEYKKLKNKDKNRVDEKDAARGRQVHKCGGIVKKHQSGDELLPIKHPKGKPSKHINRGGTKSKIPVQSCGAKVKKDCNGAVAKFKAEYGSKLKKHLLGGSLNRIPFMQAGTPKSGIQRGINGEYYYNPIPYGAGLDWGPEKLDNSTVQVVTSTGDTLNIPKYMTLELTGAPEYIPGMKAKNAWEALQMVKAMKALKAAQTASKVTKKVAKTKSLATGPKTVKLGNGYSALIEIPQLNNYQELFDAYKMTRASRLNINNILDKLPAEERANVLKVIMSNPDHYLNVLGNITPSKAGSMISTIRRRLPGEYTPLRVKSLDLTRPHMASGFFLKFEDATSKTAGFKRTTKVK